MLVCLHGHVGARIVPQQELLRASHLCHTVLRHTFRCLTEASVRVTMIDLHLVSTFLAAFLPTPGPGGLRVTVSDSAVLLQDDV